MPNLHFWRPADGNEVSAAYLVAMQSRTTPSVFSLSRQILPPLPGSSVTRAAKGGYVVQESSGASVTLVGTGSEVSVALAAAGVLESRGTKARVVSLPCWEIFKAQDATYRKQVLGSGTPILSVEAYSSFGECSWCCRLWPLTLQAGRSFPTPTSVLTVGVTLLHQQSYTSTLG